MLEYIKMIIIALFSGVMMPLPVSSEAHYSLLTKVMSCSESEIELGFYHSVFMLTFALVVFIFLRKIYMKSIKALFIADKNKLRREKLESYKKVSVNILLSLLPMALLFVPVSADTLIIDYFDRFLTQNGFFLTAIACIINAFVLVISLWYTKQNNAPAKKSSSLRDVMRMSVYQLVAFVVPGFSHVGSSATNLFVCDLHPRLIMRDVYLYLAPQMFLVGLIKIIRTLAAGLIFDPFLVIIAAVVSGAVAALVVNFAGKFSIRRLLGFFGIYSAVLGVVIVICAVIV